MAYKVNFYEYKLFVLDFQKRVTHTPRYMINGISPSKHITRVVRDEHPQ